MTDSPEITAPKRAPPTDTGILLLAAGGLAAAFGAASCCALPLLLGSVGLGGAWLLAVAWLAAPHRLALSIAAVVCLVGGGGLFLRRRWVAACAPNGACGRPVVTALVSSFLSLGGVLVVLGFLYA
ncbi:MAG TPA: mercuric reductase [Stellaceae bacterium]|nr:mercuric reductase [Stellaceae bacterium]